VLPAVLITCALGIQWAGRWLADRIAGLDWVATLVVVVIGASVISSLQAAPHFRLFTNSIGGGTARAGYYFPHDEFYDASMRDVIAEIATSARSGSRVVSESPSLAAYYAERAGRPDLRCLSMSDPETLQQLEPGDFVIVARGRRYFSNDAIVSALRDHAAPVAELKLGIVPSAKIYEVDQNFPTVMNRQKIHPLMTQLNFDRFRVLRIISIRPV
jgi:hypothetical protein